MIDPNIDAKKGDILSTENYLNKENKVPHYMVYLEPFPNNNNLFIGAMLTHSSINGNIPLQEDHFINTDEMGNNYKISFDKSMVVNHPLYKKVDWTPFRKVGQLSQKGIEFIENNIAPYVRQFIPHKLE